MALRKASRPGSPGRGETPLPNQPVDVRDFPPEDFKYADVDFVYPRTNGLVKTILYYPLSNGRNMQEIKRILTALQLSEKHGVATPANWQPGDDVIVPPPGSCGVAKVRAADPSVTMHDWFFSTKPCP